MFLPSDKSQNLSTPIVQPRLGLIHFLIWTAGSAAILACQQAFVDLSEFPPSHRTFWLVANIIYSMIYGASVGSLVICAWRQLPGSVPFPTQPGHWYLVMCGVAAVVGWAGYAAMALRYPSGDDTYEYLVARYRFYLLMRLPMDATVLFIALFAASKCIQRRWFVLFLIVAIDAILRIVTIILVVKFSDYSPFLYGIEEFVHGVGALFALPVMIVVLRLDLRAGDRRDWLHWCGVAVGVSGSSLYVVWFVWRWLLFPT